MRKSLLLADRSTKGEIATIASVKKPHDVAGPVFSVHAVLKDI